MRAKVEAAAGALRGLARRLFWRTVFKLNAGGRNPGWYSHTSFCTHCIDAQTWPDERFPCADGLALLFTPPLAAK